MSKLLPPITERKAQWREGKKRYFTGKPCCNGHVAERFVSSGACTECVNPYKVRRHPFSSELEPYNPGGLWVRRGLTAEEYVALGRYLQECVDTYCKHVRPDDPEPMTGATQTITPTGEPIPSKPV